MIEKARWQPLRNLGAIARDAARRIPNEHLRYALANEVSPVKYLNSLAEVDRRHVLEFLVFASHLATRIEPRIAINAVGSTVRPPDQNFRPIGDIDLRILNSAPTGSDERRRAVEVMRTAIRDWLEQKGIKFEERDATVTQARHSDYVDFYNDDPSFLTEPTQGLPLHLSISGVPNYDLDEHLRQERRRGLYYSPLFPTSVLSLQTHYKQGVKNETRN